MTTKHHENVVYFDIRRLELLCFLWYCNNYWLKMMAMIYFSNKLFFPLLSAWNGWIRFSFFLFFCFSFFATVPQRGQVYHSYAESMTQTEISSRWEQTINWQAENWRNLNMKRYSLGSVQALHFSVLRPPSRSFDLVCACCVNMCEGVCVQYTD